jgi:glycosyltransferase involved in cell wall biosynthesis
VRTDIDVLLGAADVFLFPSLYEGLGVSLLQALGSEVPSITTNRPPMNTIVTAGQTGWLVPAQDAESIAAAVLEVIKHPDRSRVIAMEGRRHVLDLYDSNEVARRIEALYLSIMAALET